MEAKAEKPGYAALRRFRPSLSGADYFLTANLVPRGKGLETPGLVAEIGKQWRRVEADGLWSVRSGAIMPDHVHLLINLAANADLAGSMRLFKGRMTPALRKAGLKWQDGYFEHRLRKSEDALPVFLYIYLNPYRAGLLSAGQTWPGYYCDPDDWKWFGELTREAVPQPEWLR
jgi:putative transposase